MLVREKEMRCRRGWRVGRKRVGARAVRADVESKELRMEFPARIAIELERDVASLKAVTCGYDAKSFFSSRARPIRFSFIVLEAFFKQPSLRCKTGPSPSRATRGRSRGRSSAWGS